MTLERGYLVLEADADQTGGIEQGIFELVGNLEVNNRMEIDHLFSNELSNINSVSTGLPGWLSYQGSLDDLEDLNSSRVGFFFDAGAGRNVFEINAIGWESPDDPYLWGDPNESTTTVMNAGVEWDGSGNLVRGSETNPQQQIATLMRYLKFGEFDSRRERAKLYYGEYYPDKADRPAWMPSDLPNTPYTDKKHVAVQRASVNRNAQNPESFDISIIVQETEDMTGPVDIISQHLWA